MPRHIREKGSPSVVEVERHPEAPIKVSAWPTALPFSTPFSTEVIDASCHGKVKMPTLDLYDGTTDPEEHLGVYKAQMYEQDVDDASYCHYFPAALRCLHNHSLMVCHRGVLRAFKTWRISLLANSSLAGRKGELVSTCQRSSRGHWSPSPSLSSAFIRRQC